MKYRVTAIDSEGKPTGGWTEKDAPLGEILFKEIRSFFGVVPPRGVLNRILRGGALSNTDQQYFKWEPFELSDEEYQDLREEVRSHPEWKTDIDDTYPGPPEEWSHWALVRAMDENRKRLTRRER